MKYYTLLLLIVSIACTQPEPKKEEPEIIIDSSKTNEERIAEALKAAEEATSKVPYPTIALSTELFNKGVRFRSIEIRGTEASIYNVLIIYFEFDKDFDRTVKLTLLDKNGKEYGHTSRTVKNTSGGAGNYSFVFDKTINIKADGKLSFE